MALIRCSCKDPRQDKINGKRIRVGNRTVSSPQKTYRCTKYLKEVPESHVVRT